MTCPWTFHGVTRRPHGDGTVTLTLDGWRYATSAERDPGGTSACRWCRLPVVRNGTAWRSPETGAFCGPAGEPGFWRHSPRPGPAAVRAPAPCATWTGPERTEARGRETWVLYECDTADGMVKAHCGAHYSAVFHGRGWTAELSSGYPLWQVTT